MSTISFQKLLIHDPCYLFSSAKMKLTNRNKSALRYGSFLQKVLTNPLIHPYRPQTAAKREEKAAAEKAKAEKEAKKAAKEKKAADKEAAVKAALKGK